MLLEAGLKKDDDRKPLRGSLRDIMTDGFASGLYEKRMRYSAVGLFAIWMTFMLFHLGSSNTNVSSTLQGNTNAADTRHPISTESTENASPDEIDFVVFGDYGTGTDSQIQVAHTMRKFVSTLDAKISFVLSTGDQIYEHGYAKPCFLALLKRVRRHTSNFALISVNPQDHISKRPIADFQIRKGAAYTVDVVALFESFVLTGMMLAILQMYDYPELRVPWYVA